MSDRPRAAALHRIEGLYSPGRKRLAHLLTGCWSCGAGSCGARMSLLLPAGAGISAILRGDTHAGSMEAVVGALRQRSRYSFSGCVAVFR
jgi:hypothetical protein